MNLARISLALTIVCTLAACEDSTVSGIGAGGSSSSTSASSGAVDCEPTLPSSPAGCPTTPEAEGAFSTMMATCSLTMDDVDFSNLDSPHLTAAGKVKLCASCECEQKAFDYHAVYANCTDSNEASNAALAASVHADAVACQD